jgi:hypothetical protein
MSTDDFYIDPNHLFDMWLKNQHFEHDKNLSLLKKAYLEGYKEGNKKKSEQNWEMWNQK